MNRDEYDAETRRAAQLFEAGDVEGAIGVFEALSRSGVAGGLKAIACHNLATCYLQAGKFAKAEETYSRGVAYELLAGTHVVREAYAAFLADREEFERSAQLYELLAESQGVGEDVRERSRANASLLRSKLAWQAVENATITMEQYFADTQRGSDLLEQGQAQAAAHLFERLAGETIPASDRTIAWLNAANCWEKLERDREAEAAYRRAVAVDPGFSGYYVKERFGAFLSSKGRYRESLAVYREVFRAPDLDDAHRGRIQANIEYLESKSV